MDRQALLRRRLLAAGLLLAAVLSVLPIIDQQARHHYDDLMQRAFVTFALARTLNGVISVVQGTELALQPAGVGVTLTPGEILDPVNDLVERFSWVMLGATISLGIQQVLMDISAWWLLKGLVAVLAVWLMLLLLRPQSPNPGSGRQILTKVFLLALFLRFAVPLTLLINDAVYQLFLEHRYQTSSELVLAAGQEIEQIGQQQPVEEEASDQGLFGSGVFGSLGQAMERTRDALDLGEKVDRIKARAAEMIEHLVQLSVVFILQTGVLPIVFLWLFLQLGKWVIGYSRK